MFKPMLAATLSDTSSLVYPVLASVKFDGVRAIVRDGVVYSRSGKPIPNRHVQALFGNHEYLDGELILGSPRARDVFKRTTSAVMSINGSHDVKFYVFDHIMYPLMPFINRMQMIYSDDNIYPVPQTFIDSEKDLIEFEERALKHGYDGVMIRSIGGQYKNGRSTLKSRELLKLRRSD